MGTILFLLLFFFVLLPLARIAWAAWRQYRLLRDHMRRAQEFEDRFRRAAGATDSAHEPQQPAARKKKIDPDVGEYVQFEEMRVYASDDIDEAPAATEAPAEQIEDADWEDITGKNI